MRNHTHIINNNKGNYTHEIINDDRPSKERHNHYINIGNIPSILKKKNKNDNI